MGNLYCGLIFVFLVPAGIIVLGLINIFKKDWAWQITKSMLKHVRPQRTPEWEHGITINGVILLAFGILWIVFLLSIILSGGS